MSVRRFGWAVLSTALLVGRVVEEGWLSELEGRFRSNALFWLLRRLDITLLILESIVVSAFIVGSESGVS